MVTQATQDTPVASKAEALFTPEQRLDLLAKLEKAGAPEVKSVPEGGYRVDAHGEALNWLIAVSADGRTVSGTEIRSSGTSELKERAAPVLDDLLYRVGSYHRLSIPVPIGTFREDAALAVVRDLKNQAPKG